MSLEKFKGSHIDNKKKYHLRTRNYLKKVIEKLKVQWKAKIKKGRGRREGLEGEAATVTKIPSK